MGKPRYLLPSGTPPKPGNSRILQPPAPPVPPPHPSPAPGEKRCRPLPAPQRDEPPGAAELGRAPAAGGSRGWGRPHGCSPLRAGQARRGLGGAPPEAGSASPAAHHPPVTSAPGGGRGTCAAAACSPFIKKKKGKKNTQKKNHPRVFSVPRNRRHAPLASPHS